MFVNIGMVTSCFGVPMTPAERMVSLVFASNSSDGECKISPTIVEQTGMSSNTYTKALKSLVGRGILGVIRRGWYRVQLEVGKKDWVNLEYFKMLLNADLPYKEKLMLIAITKHVPEGKDYCFPKVSTLAKLTCVSTRAAQRTLAILKDKGIVVRFKHKGFWFIQINSVVLPSIVVPKKATIAEVAKDLFENTSQQNDENVHPKDQSWHTQNAITSPSNKDFNNEEKEIKKGGVAPASELPLAEENMIDHNRKRFAPARRERGGKGVDVLKVVKDKKPVIKLSIEGLVYVWRKELPKVLDLDSMAEATLTNKQVHMMKHLLKVGKSWGMDPRLFLHDVLWNWHRYTNSVATKADLFNVPDSPIVEWVVKWADMLYQSYSEFQKETEKEPVQVIAKVAPKAEDAEPVAPKTPEEILAGLKAKVGGLYND